MTTTHRSRTNFRGRTPGTKTFKPIDNDNLASYDGQKLIIRNLRIVETGDAGLFGTTDAALSRIRLVNASVTGGGSVGALAGNYKGTTITDCGVYVSDGSLYESRVVSGGVVGGLVGSLGGAQVQESFAAVKVTGTTAGGLVGEVNANAALQNCCSGGHTVDGAYSPDATDNVAGSDAVGGLVGTVTGSSTLTLEGIDYSTCSVQTSGAASETGLLVGGSTSNVIKNSGTAYATGEAYQGGSKIPSGLHDETDYLDTSFGDNTTGDFVTHPYDQYWIDSGVNYPYATNLKEHYGDWPTITASTPSAQSLCYYEVYAGGDYGFWGYLSPTEPLKYNLKEGDTSNTDLEYAIEDGYGVLVKDGEDVPTLSDPACTIDTSTPLKEDAYTDSRGSTYDLYKIEIDTTSFPSTDYYTKITVGTKDYWFNPFFACEVQTADPGPNPGAKVGAAGQGDTDDYDGQVVIRTARQLANLATATKDTAAQARAYVQLLDIDYGEYTDVAMGTDSLPQSPAALSDAGSYDGNHFVIKNLYIDGAGLFGEAAGTLSNIRLVNVSVSGGSNVGALAGQFPGTATDCGVYLDVASDIDDAYNNTFIVTGDENVGGLIGLMDNGGLSKCFAAVKVEGGDNVGGLIGLFNDDGSGNTLTLSGVNYSTCSVTGTDPADSLGLLIGYAEVGSVNIDDADAIYSTGTAFGSSGPLDSGDIRDETDYLTTDLSGIETDTKTAHPYDTALFDHEGKALDYPYISGLTEHYGDWMAAEKVEACGIAYFEEENGEIKLQIRGYFSFDGTDTILDYANLCTDKDWKSISSAGYVTFKTGDPEVAPWGNELELDGYVDVTQSSNGDDVYNLLTKAIQEFLRGEADKETASSEAPLDTLLFNIYDSANIDPDYIDSLSPSIEVGGDNVYYTVGFAGLSDTAFDGVANPFLIRTARQLDNIPDGDGDGSTTSPTSGMNFRQTHDITGEDGYSGAIEFAGTFDGRGYRIQSLKSAEEAADCTGLFESLTDGATISNAVLYSDNMDYELNVEDNDLVIGGIANKASGTVSLTNCAVVGYHHEFDISKNDVTSFNYGELIGEVESGGIVTITNCAAINNAELNIMYARNAPLSCYYAGLVGKIAGDLILTNCYTGGTGILYDYGTGSGGGSVGVAPETGMYGLTGQISGSVTAKNCYSWMIDGFKSTNPAAQLSPSDFKDSEDNYYIYDNEVTERRGELRKYTEFWADSWQTNLDINNHDGKFGKAASSHPFTTTDNDIKYDDFPFPEVIREVNKDGTPGGFIHYGDWPSQATSGPEFGFYFVYSSDSQHYAGGNLDSYAVGLMYDKDGESSYAQSRIGVTSEDGPQKQKPEHIPYWGFAIRKANKSKMDDTQAKLSVELYNETGTMLSKLESADVGLKPTENNNDKFTNESEYAGYDLYISTDMLPDTVQSALKATGSTVVVVVKYGGTEIARFSWSTFDPKALTNPTAGDPGMPEGPSFEGAMAPAATEAVVPEKLELPKPEGVG